LKGEKIVPIHWGALPDEQSVFPITSSQVKSRNQGIVKNQWTGRKGASPTDTEVQLAEVMIQRGVLRLDWHTENEQGQTSAPLRDGSSYLSRIFEKLG
jgi:hypothetical protein